MRQLRVENTLYNLSDDVWRQVNDLLGKAEGTTQLTQEMLKDETPLDKPKRDAPPDESSGSGSGESKPLGEDLSDEEKP